MRQTRTLVKVLVVEVCLPHYRVPFFRRLCGTKEFEVTIAAGKHGPGGSPKSERHTPGVRRAYLNNYFIGRQLAVQTGLFPLALQADVVILDFNPRILSNLWFFGRRKILRKSTIWWGHGLGRRRTPWVLALRRYMAMAADAVIFYSMNGMTDFLQLGVPKDKLFVARNSLDITRILKLSKLNSSIRPHRILTIGRLVPQKKVDLLIEAFALCAGQLPNGTTLAIIGDGPERQKLEGRVHSLGIENRVEFAGALYDEYELAKWFKSALMSVSPGYVGLSIVHSFAYGVPMLVANNEFHSPEIEALVPGINGLLFDSNDPISLASSIVTLVNDRERLEQMSRAAEITVSKGYGIQDMVEVFKAAITYAYEHQ